MLSRDTPRKLKIATTASNAFDNLPIVAGIVPKAQLRVGGGRGEESVFGASDGSSSVHLDTTDGFTIATLTHRGYLLQAAVPVLVVYPT